MSDNDFRAFYQLSKAWYGKFFLPEDDLKDEIMLGLYGSECETSGEFAIRWRQVGDEWIPRLESFNDSWGVLLHFHDVIRELSKTGKSSHSPEEVVKVLESLGIENITKTERG